MILFNRKKMLEDDYHEWLEEIHAYNCPFSLK